jgi:fructoselysine 6-kinase
VAVVGDACIDVYVDTDQSRSAVGGNAVNVAVDLARHGVNSEFVGVVGDDAHGDRICRALREAGVGVEGVRRLHGPSWVSHITRDERGVAVVETEEPGVAGPYLPLDAELDSLVGFDHVHLVNLADPSRMLERLADRGVSASYDFGRTEAERTSAFMAIAFSSRPESESQLAEQVARRMVEQGARLAIVTLGAHGSVALFGERLFSTPAEKIEPVDTLGAGDSFIAAFLAAWLANAPLDAALRTGHRYAARTCLEWAAWPQTAAPGLDVLA